MDISNRDTIFLIYITCNYPDDSYHLVFHDHARTISHSFEKTENTDAVEDMISQGQKRM
jgi:hypothetical protein